MKHEFTAEDGRHCDECGCSYHCARCGEGSSMLGHFAKDADGTYFSCEDPERRDRHLKALIG